MAGPDRYLPRHIDGRLEQALSSSPVVILDGARATGKTTSAARRAASEVRLPRDLEALASDPAGYLRSLPPPVLIDEWQLAGTDLLWTVKGLVDDEPAPGQFILTGSVEPAAYGPTYPLTGRAIRLFMRPMTRAELEGHGAEPAFLERLLAGADPGEICAVREPSTFDLGWLTRTGFPAAQGLPEPQLFLDAYASTVAQRAGEEGRDSTRLLRTMRALATLTAQATPDQRVWEAADITKVTWRQYDDLLERVHLSAPSAAFESNRLKRLTAFPKRFLADTALAAALAGTSGDDLRANPALAGRFFESFVVQQLRTQADIAGGQLLHLRTGAGEREVDVVVEAGSHVVAAEVKLSTRPTRHDARQLEWLRSELADRFSHGFVIHTGTDFFSLGDRLWALPVTALVASGPT